MTTPVHVTPDRPKIVFFGSDAICLPALDYLAAQGAELCELCAVISQPDRPQGRGKKLQGNPVAEWARSKGIPLLQPEKPTRELADWLRAESVAVAFVMAYGHFLAKTLREAPLRGMWNFHGSILPEYRGASPVETAVAMGVRATGVCLMEIVKEMDAGAVADCEHVDIDADETAPEVRAKVGRAVVPLLSRNLADVLSGALRLTPQDVARATFCRKIRKDDAALDFTLPARAIYDRLRAFTPWPGGYFDHDGTRIKVGRAAVEAGMEAAVPPGTVLAAESVVRVSTADGVIVFHELQRPGGRMLPVADFLRGYPIGVGEMLRGGKSEPLLREEP